MRIFTVGLLALTLLATACGGGSQPASDLKDEKKDEKKVEKKAAAAPCDPKATIPVKPAEVPDTVEIQHILIAFDGNPQNPHKPREPRTKAQAEKLVKELLERARNCEDFNKLVTKYSDDPYRSQDSKYNMYPGFFEISPKAVVDPPFKACAKGMSPGNIDMVESRYGFHVILRRK